MEWLEDKFVKNWKTTLIGVGGFALTGIVNYPEHFPPIVVYAAKFVLTSGVLTIGVSASDSIFNRK